MTPGTARGTGGLRRYWTLSYATAAAFVVLLVVGFALVRVDGAVVANGEVSLATGPVEVHTPSGGLVSRVLVENGDLVQPGQVLVRLDDSAIASRLATARTIVDAMGARVLRIQCALDGVASMGERPLNVSEEIWNTEEALLADVLRSVELERAEVEHQITLHDAELTAAKAELGGLRTLRDTAAAELNEARVAGSPLISSLEQRLVELDISVASAQSAVKVAQAEVANGSLGLEAIAADFGRATAAELETAQLDLQQAASELAELETAAAQSEITAEVSGTVSNLAVQSGSLAQVGTVLMEIVVTTAPPQATLWVSPNDIDDVSEGQRVKVRVDAIANRGNPEIGGEVIVVAASPTQLASGAQLFRVLVELDTRPESPLTVGMPVTAHLATGDRTFLEYLLDPVTDDFRDALSEH